MANKRAQSGLANAARTTMHDDELVIEWWFELIGWLFRNSSYIARCFKRWSIQSARRLHTSSKQRTSKHQHFASWVHRNRRIAASCFRNVKGCCGDWQNKGCDARNVAWKCMRSVVNCWVLIVYNVLPKSRANMEKATKLKTWLEQFVTEWRSKSGTSLNCLKPSEYPSIRRRRYSTKFWRQWRTPFWKEAPNGQPRSTWLLFVQKAWLPKTKLESLIPMSQRKLEKRRNELARSTKNWTQHGMKSSRCECYWL